MYMSLNSGTQLLSHKMHYYYDADEIMFNEKSTNKSHLCQKRANQLSLGINQI